ncbi:hypothetical protein ACFS7Z_16510 [Pontibacter toksunensis]|uniref:Uncharacterized protein n=1 Tax=Pontibacter toksunensis TaxID=1332631 RepID=A0ABW6BY92_9BACT
MIVKVHGQKSNIGGNINVPETVIKLYAVVDTDLAFPDMNVLEVKIAVAILNPVLLHTFFK